GQRHGGHRWPSARMQSAGLEVCRALAQHHPRRSRRGGAERGGPCSPWQARRIEERPTEGSAKAGGGARVSQGSSSTARPKLVVMKFGGTSVEDAAAMRRTAAIVRGRRERGLQPVVVVSAMAKVTDQLLAAAAAAG